jgi:hypothetical protein
LHPSAPDATHSAILDQCFLKELQCGYGVLRFLQETAESDCSCLNRQLAFKPCDVAAAPVASPE